MSSPDDGDIANLSAIPDFEIEAIARRIYPTLRAFYDSPEGQVAFEKWKRERTIKPQPDKSE